MQQEVQSLAHAQDAQDATEKKKQEVRIPFMGSTQTVGFANKLGQMAFESSLTPARASAPA